MYYDLKTTTLLKAFINKGSYTIETIQQEGIYVNKQQDLDKKRYFFEQIKLLENQMCIEENRDETTGVLSWVVLQPRANEYLHQLEEDEKPIVPVINQNTVVGNNAIIQQGNNNKQKIQTPKESINEAEGKTTMFGWFKNMIFEDRKVLGYVFALVIAACILGFILGRYDRPAKAIQHVVKEKAGLPQN